MSAPSNLLGADIFSPKQGSREFRCRGRGHGPAGRLHKVTVVTLTPSLSSVGPQIDGHVLCLSWVRSFGSVHPVGMEGPEHMVRNWPGCWSPLESA